MNIVADLHCHTVFSQHAYNTLRDNLNAAMKKNLKAIAITDHGIGMEDAPHLSYFQNLISLPRYADGLCLLRGVEANIMDYEGKLDMPEEVLEELDIVIASYHTNCMKPGTREQHTDSYIRIAQNPYVNIIGHSGTPEFEYDFEKVIPLFKQYRKVVEINAHTFICRQSSVGNCRRIAWLCKEYEVPVMVNSDAHSEFEVGECKKALEMLEELHFPEELVINSNWEQLKAYLKSIGVAGL